MLIVARAMLMNPWSLLLLCAVIAPLACSPAARRSIRLFASFAHQRMLSAHRQEPQPWPYVLSRPASQRRANLRLALECQRLC
jgi:hypothetical protein